MLFSPLSDNEPVSTAAPSHPVQHMIEAERYRIAGQLQQALLGQVNLLIAQANVYEQTTPDPQARVGFSVLGNLARQLLQKIYDLEADLHPPALESLGLEAALEALAQQQRRSRGLQVSLSLSRLRERLAPAVELALYRTVQDAIERAVPLASLVVIQMEYSNSTLTLVIHDNGIVPQDDVLRATRPHLESLGASLVVRSSRYGGAEITITLRMTGQSDLTARELEVLRLLVTGLANKEIARALQVSTRTVKFHLDNIYSKLGVNTRTEAAVYALQQGWIQRDDLSG